MSNNDDDQLAVSKMLSVVREIQVEDLVLTPEEAAALSDYCADHKRLAVLGRHISGTVTGMPLQEP